jgi:SAM-dependent methyltransferase
VDPDGWTMPDTVGSWRRAVDARWRLASRCQEKQSVRVSVAPDGSPIALYRAIPGDEEAALIHGAIPASAAVLELGCGVGRVSRHLVALGHPVTGVDNSDAMLAQFARVPGVEPILADIASLELRGTWPVVVLGSQMINGPQGEVFLSAAARHVEDGGVLLIQRYEPGWVDAAQTFSADRHGVLLSLAEVEHAAPGVLRATMIYRVAGRSYRQPFIAYEVSDARLDAMAADAGLKVVGGLNDERTWMVLGRGWSGPTPDWARTFGQPAPQVDRRSAARAGPPWGQVGGSMRAVSDPTLGATGASSLAGVRHHATARARCAGCLHRGAIRSGRGGYHEACQLLLAGGPGFGGRPDGWHRGQIRTSVEDKHVDVPSVDRGPEPVCPDIQ